MRFTQTNADLYIPDNRSVPGALARTTHLAVGAHQDDLEFMALHGILECYRRDDLWFGGVVCTDGAGSARTGPYADHTDEAMRAARAREQRAAAAVGEYAFAAQLGHPSAHAKRPGARAPLTEDLTILLEATRPRILYTHNPFDKHATHVGVLIALLEALRSLPAEARPERLLGCEVWRGLDWLPDADKVVLDVSDRPNLAAALHGVFDSQIAGGKRYDLAVLGRHRANATFLQSHATDACDSASYAVDLTPLTAADAPSLGEFVEERAAAFTDDLRATLRDVDGGPG